MGMIDGREPKVPDEVAMPDLRARVVVKFVADTDLRQSADETAQLAGQRIAGEAWARALDSLGDVSVRHYRDEVWTPTDRPDLIADEGPANVLDQYLVIELSTGTAARLRGSAR